MATPAVTPVESATTEPLVIPADGPERQEWLKTGNLPTKKEPEVKTEAESSPAQDADAESSAADLETAEVEEVEEQPVTPPKKRGAEARIHELLEENKRLKAQIGTKETQAEPSPAPTSAAPKKPNVADYNTVGEYEAAYDDYIEKLTEYKASEVVKRSEFTRELQSKLADARKRYDNFDDVAAPIVQRLTDGSIDKSVLEAIDDSPVFSDLLYVIGGEEANVEDFLKLAKSNPRAAIKRVGALEQIISDELQKTSEKAPERNDKGQFVTDKKISKAPPPPTEISTSGSPPDEVAQAVERKDFGAFKAAEDRRDLARRKGR